VSVCELKYSKVAGNRIECFACFGFRPLSQCAWRNRSRFCPAFKSRFSEVH
jgi:hypothetical protein